MLQDFGSCYYRLGGSIWNKHKLELQRCEFWQARTLWLECSRWPNSRRKSQGTGRAPACQCVRSARTTLRARREGGWGEWRDTGPAAKCLWGALDSAGVSTKKTSTQSILVATYYSLECHPKACQKEDKWGDPQITSQDSIPSCTVPGVMWRDDSPGKLSRSPSGWLSTAHRCPIERQTEGAEMKVVQGAVFHGGIAGESHHSPLQWLCNQLASTPKGKSLVAIYKLQLVKSWGPS